MHRLLRGVILQPVQTTLPPPPARHHLLITGGVILLAAAVLLAMGRGAISESGRIMLWVGEAGSSETSQQLFDWYSFSHVIHGIAFYALFRLASFGRWSAGTCLIAAVALEAAWEVFENTPFTIDRYRTATIALNYYGDSVLNSVMDILCCVAGFFLAWRVPAWVSVCLVVIMEVGVAMVIRDNLTLNIIMFLWPIEAILKWQSGA